MDFYMEYMIKKKKDGKDMAIIAVIIALGVVLTLAMLAVIFAAAFALAGSQISSFAFSIGFVLIALIWYGAYLLLSMRNIEYEYILTNSEIDFDRIMSKKGRKRVASFDFTEAEICASIEDNEHNYAYKNQTQDVKVLDLTGDKTRGSVYFVDYSDSDKNQKMRVLFQPTSRMIEAIRKSSPRNVFIYEE